MKINRLYLSCLFWLWRAMTSVRCVRNNWPTLHIPSSREKSKACFLWPEGKKLLTPDVCPRPLLFHLSIMGEEIRAAAEG